LTAKHRRPTYRASGEGPLGHAVAMVGTGVLLGLAGAGLDSLLGTAPVLLIVFVLFAAASAFASAYYRYAARLRLEDAGKPWARRSAQ